MVLRSYMASDDVDDDDRDDDDDDGDGDDDGDDDDDDDVPASATTLSPRKKAPLAQSEPLHTTPRRAPGAPAPKTERLLPSPADVPLKMTWGWVQRLFGTKRGAAGSKMKPNC